MTNKEIGQILLQIAKILEIQDNAKNRFRIVAYERASQTVESFAEELSEVYKKGGREALDAIPDIGESIAEKIEELLKTGKLKYLDEISKNVPASEVEFLKIPGIGPKTAVKIAKELKATSIGDLKKKIESGKADKIFQEKGRANILRGIEVLSKLTGRLLLTEALPIAEDIVARIKEIPTVEQVDFVGSLRRWKETVGDIDIVATSKSPSMVIEKFTRLPIIDHIINKGETKSTILHEQGVQVDLEIVPNEEYGSLLQHFTGSKEHNVALRTYAQSKLMSVSEHGIKKGKTQHKFDNEKGVYEFLGMDYIVPELRENRGEIARALKHQLPKLVELSDIKGDLHVHSNWSDGTMSIEEIAEAGEKLDYEYIVISDHTVGLGIAGGLDEKDLRERQKEIDAVQKKHPKIKILSSVEINIKANGDLDINDEMLGQLDLVTASVHTSFNQSKEVMTKRLIGAINHPHVDIIGHPSGRLIGQREPYEVDWPEIFKACAKTETALEISAFPNRLDLADYLCQEAKKFGVKFAISTDTHQPHHFELIRFGVAVARRGWLEKKDIINTSPLDDLLKWAKRSMG